MCLCRGLLKRRYKEIICDFSDVSMRERRVGMSEETAGDVVQALLPSLLAACSPETELTLKVLPTQGKPCTHCCDRKSYFVHCRIGILSFFLRNSTPLQMYLCF